MKYNLQRLDEVNKAAEYLSELARLEKVVEIKRVDPTRSLSQNNYLHLLLSAFGNHFGYTLEEAKQVYKELNADIYRYKRKNRTFYRSSADLSTDEMAKTVDKFMQASAEQGCELPLATDPEWIMQIQNEIERSGYR